MGKGGYGLTYQEVYEMENLTIEAKAIYGMLCSYAGSKAMAYPSVDFICDKLKISRTRFYKHMNLFLTIILLAIFTTEFLNFCTNALIWVNLDRKERENEKHID